MPVKSQAAFSPVAVILPLLKQVRQRGPGSWMALCPAHDDHSPSLAIRETSDGAVLIHCFTGCSVGAITAALGLSVADLFPHPAALTGPGPRPPAYPWRDALKALAHDMQVVQLAAARLAAGDELDDNALADMGLAAVHIYDVLEEIAR